MRKIGIDISYWNRNSNLEEIIKNQDFVIIRLGSHLNPDSEAKNYVELCEKHNIPYGFYWYTYAKNINEALAEATCCIENVKPFTPSYPVFFDFEETAGNKDLNTLIIRTFCDTLFAEGIYTGIYINPNFLIYHVNDSQLLGLYDIWLAHWTKSPDIQSRFNYAQTLWQWGTRNFDGNKIDSNICFINYPERIERYKNSR